MYAWAGNGSTSAGGNRGNDGAPQELQWGPSPGAGGEVVGGSLGGEGFTRAGVGGAHDGAYGVQRGYETNTSSSAPPPPSQPLGTPSPSNYANHATLYSLLQQGIISQDQFDVLVTVPPPPGRTTLGGAPRGSQGGGQQATGQQAYAPAPGAPTQFPTLAPPSATPAPYHLASTSAPLYHPIPPPPHPYQQARPQAYQPPTPPPQQQQRPLPPISSQEMQSHLVAMDQIQVWQQRLRLLMESLLSGFYPPGVVNAQPIGQAQRESMEREVGELNFIARSGGPEHVSSEVRAFRARPPPPQLAAPLPSPPLRPPSTLQSTTPTFTPLAPLPLPTPPLQPLYHSPSANSNLLIGPQGAGRMQARSTQPTTFPSSRPLSALGASATTGGPLTAPPKQDEGPKRKSATQILLEGRLGMPTLAQLQAQLTASTFKDSLAKVLKKKGIVLQEFWVESRLVSLYDLYQKVMISGGGGEKVATDNAWNRIANLLSYRHDSGPRLAEIYRSVLAPYEEVWSEVLLRQQEALLAKRASGRGSNEEIARTRGASGENLVTRGGVETSTAAGSSTGEQSWGSLTAMGPQQQLHAIGLGALPSQVQASTTASRFASSQSSSYDSLPSLSHPVAATLDTDSSASPSTWRSPALPVVDLPNRRTDISEVLAEARRLKESVSACKARDAASSQPRPPSAQSHLRLSVPSNPLPLHPALAAPHTFTPPTPTVGLSDLFALTTTGPRQLPDSGQFEDLREPPTKQRRVGGLAQTAAASSPAESTKSAGSAKAGEEGTASAKKRTRSEELLDDDSGASPMSFADALGASQREARPFDFAQISSFAPSFAPAPPPSSEVRHFDPFPISVTPSCATPSFDPFLSFSPSHLSPSHSTVETPELAAPKTELSPPSDVKNDRALGSLSKFEGYDPSGGTGSATRLSEWGRGGGQAKWDEEARWGLGGGFGDAGGYGTGEGTGTGAGFGMDGDAFEQGKYGWGS